MSALTFELKANPDQRLDLSPLIVASVGFLSGSVPGAVFGFCFGLFADTALMQTLGVTSLVLTVAGYWIGRYGETTGRDRAHAPLLAVLVITVAVALAALVLLVCAGPAAAGEQVPFRGNVDGVITNTPLEFPLLFVDIAGTGNASLLGQFTVSIPHLVDRSNSTGSDQPSITM